MRCKEVNPIIITVTVTEEIPTLKDEQSEDGYQYSMRELVLLVKGSNEEPLFLVSSVFCQLIVLLYSCECTDDFDLPNTIFAIGY